VYWPAFVGCVGWRISSASYTFTLFEFCNFNLLGQKFIIFTIVVHDELTPLYLQSHFCSISMLMFPYYISETRLDGVS
jgi:hypothetical protein